MYPKCLYGVNGFDDLTDCVTVNNSEEERIVRDAGYHDLSNPKEVAAKAAEAIPITKPKK